MVGEHQENENTKAKIDKERDKIRKGNFDFCLQIHYMDWQFISLIC